MKHLSSLAKNHLSPLKLDLASEAKADTLSFRLNQFYTPTGDKRGRASNRRPDPPDPSRDLGPLRRADQDLGAHLDLLHEDFYPDFEPRSVKSVATEKLSSKSMA